MIELNIEYFDILKKTGHVFCPDCGAETYGPYHDIRNNVYFDGHYCEECGVTWHWDNKQETFLKGW